MLVKAEVIVVVIPITVNLELYDRARNNWLLLSKTMLFGENRAALVEAVSSKLFSFAAFEACNIKMLRGPA